MPGVSGSDGTEKLPNQHAADFNHALKNNKITTSFIDIEGAKKQKSFLLKNIKSWPTRKPKRKAVKNNN